jgi:hypothetical protein
MFQDKLTKSIAEAAAQIKTEPPKNEVNTKSVEGAVVSIMANEELKGNQHKIDANKNGKVDAHDFKLLRAKKGVKEETELDEASKKTQSQDEKSKVAKAIGAAMNKGDDLVRKGRDERAAGRFVAKLKYGKMNKEEVDHVTENTVTTQDGDKVKVGDGIGYKDGHEQYGTVHKIEGDNVHIKSYDSNTGEHYIHRKHKSQIWKEEVDINEAFPTVADAKKRMASKESGFEKKKVSTGTVYSRKYKAEPEENDEMPKKKAKTMKEMLSIYSTGGAEALVENLMIEEPSQDEYKKETEIAQAKAEGKIRNDKGIAKPATQGVKMEEVEIEVLDADEINGVQIDNIEERSMTDAEMNKREEIVKSMKKGMQGFKDRYGDKAKNVMYATATKQAMKEDAESVDELYNPVTVKKGTRRSVDSSGRVSYSGGVRVKGSGVSSGGKLIGHQMDVEKRKESMWKQKHPILSKIKSAGSTVSKAIDKVAAIKIGNKRRAGG